MALASQYLAFSTGVDASEDPPSSVDPLGTLSDSERLADVILPGFTSRMWRPRFVTFATLAAVVASRVVRNAAGKEDLRTPARLAFERLYVSAILRATREQGRAFAGADKNLPGSSLAAAAYDAKEPLVPGNFLRGQAVNGPSGVMVRLARSLGVVDDDWCPGVNSPNLLLAWAADQRLHGLLDEDREREGAAWLGDVVKHTETVLAGGWPGPKQQVWWQLAAYLRPDKVLAKERALLLKLLDARSLRRKVLRRLVEADEAYQLAPEDRGTAERIILEKELPKRLGNSAEERQIAAVLKAIGAYEQACALFEQAFDGLLWGLRLRGRATVKTLLSQKEVAAILKRTRTHLPGCAKDLQRAGKVLGEQAGLDHRRLTKPLEAFRSMALGAAASNEELTKALLDRHEAVQRDKHKGAWIDRAEKLTLMPGFGIEGEAPSIYEGAFRHPYRVTNAYAFLSSLKRIPARGANGRA